MHALSLAVAAKSIIIYTYFDRSTEGNDCLQLAKVRCITRKPMRRCIPMTHSSDLSCDHVYDI